MASSGNATRKTPRFSSRSSGATSRCATGSCDSRQLEFVAELPHRRDEPRLRWVRFELVAERIDEAVDAPRRDRAIVAPDACHDAVAAERAARVGREKGEQLEFLGRER